MLRVLISRWVLTFVGMALLALLVWIFGPLLPELEPVLTRVLVIQTMLLIWGAANAALTLRQRARDKAITAGVAGGGLAAGEEAAAVGEKLRSALALLKRSGKRAYLNELPWYVIIGPPGAGKTTALLNAGLRFPLADQMGSAVLSGVGGTRLCEWWFTDAAVLIDTAGRYTTQDSDAAIDRAGWEAFLAMLKRTRPRQPLNGVIVAIGLPTVLDPAEAASHATAISRRVAELETRLEVRLPVYALFTKADLIAGFTESFEELDRDARDQVWGVTFPFSRKPSTGDGERFVPAFRILLDRLAARVTLRLQNERRVERRGPIAGFPAQLGSLEKPLATFLSAAFSGFGGRAPPMLRGVYFASGTQEGTPFDRLTGAMTRAFGIDQRRPAALRPEQGRSYFLGRLVRDVVFGEAMLVREAPGAARRRLAFAVAGYALVLTGVVAAVAVLASAAATTQRETEAAAARLDSYGQAARAIPLDPVADGDLRQVSALLDQAQALDHGGTGGGWLAQLGLWQGGKLAAGERSIYANGIANGLLPRLLWRLEAQMRGSLARPERLYDATRIYLMLGGAGPLDKSEVRDWMAADWSTLYPAEEDTALRASLAHRLDKALAEPLPTLALDGALVAAARTVLARVPAADRIYTAIRTSAAAQHLPPWRPVDAMGAAGAAIFVRSSGRSMVDGIPGFLTATGFRTVLLPALDAATRAAAAESWVIGSRAEISQGELQSLSGTVLARYVAEFQRAWDGMLADLNVRPLQSMVQAAQVLYVLASPETPLRNLLSSLAQQLKLSAPAGSPAAVLDSRYRSIVDAAPGPAGSPLDPALRQLAEIQQILAKLAALPVGAALPGGGEAFAAGLTTEAARQPQPVSRWLGTVATSATALRTGNVKGQAAAIYNAPGGPAQVCQASLNGRFPFASSAGAADMPLDEFARLLAPGGLLDGFFNLQLKPFADIGSRPWKLQPAGTVQPPMTPADLLQFQRAAAIRDALFAGGQRPAVQFDIQPVSLGSNDLSVTLDIGGTVIGYNRGPSHATQIVWPGADPTAAASLAFAPSGQDLVESGPWALLRLFARGRMLPGKEPGRFTLSFQVNGHSAAFDVRAGSDNNPFTPGLLKDFRCPAVQ